MLNPITSRLRNNWKPILLTLFTSTLVVAGVANFINIPADKPIVDNPIPKIEQNDNVQKLKTLTPHDVNIEALNYTETSKLSTTGNKLAVENNTILAKQDDAYTDGIKLLSYNVYLMSKLLTSWSQDERADRILSSGVLDGYDVVVLNELFDKAPSQKILNTIKQQYPHQTPILGKSYNGWDETLGSYKNTGFEAGGVSIVSRWPIVEQIQYIYKSGCGGEALANKGFVYTRLNKNGEDYHVIGTHVQSEDTYCYGADVGVRKQQFTEIQQFVADKNIPIDDVLFIAGDMNVKNQSKEYLQMLETLRVKAPTYAGLDATWDPKTNGIAYKNYPDLESQYLDYIFVSRDHAQPTHWHNQALDVMTESWTNKGSSFKELSDHYPIAGFAYADENTRTESYRNLNLPYNDIKLRNKANGAYLTIDKYQNDGWVMVNGTQTDANSSFIMDTWYPKDKASCIMNNDYIQLRSNLREGSYLNWWLGSANGKYAYYTKENNASDRLRVQILNDDGDCLKNGDDIAFYDMSTLSGNNYYLQRRAYGSHTDKVFMWSDNVGDNETFTIEMKEGKKEDWSDKLVYKPAM